MDSVGKSVGDLPEDVTLRRVGAQEGAECIEALADVLVDCVEGGACVGFLRPLARQKAVSFWRGVIEGVARGERVLLVAQNRSGRIVGTVQMITRAPENQRHRADVAKMLVRRDARRRGIGRRLMAALDEAARQEGKALLVLDTATGGDAERLYERAGWQRVGVIPKYALTPGGEYVAATFFFKPL